MVYTMDLDSIVYNTCEFKSHSLYNESYELDVRFH